MHTFHVFHNDVWTDQHAWSLMRLEGDPPHRLRTKSFHAFTDLTGSRLDGPKSIRLTGRQLSTSEAP
jgi:hypothetical protein